MNRPVKARGGRCPRDAERDSCPMQCRYNHFVSPQGLVIDSWDLKCLDCGIRETIAYRSDELEEGAQPTRCPFCEQDGFVTGTNPCCKSE
ncbi:MAG: hypothetical protein ABL888_12215 [Pirellulaceae bacterium]